MPISAIGPRIKIGLRVNFGVRRVRGFTLEKGLQRGLQRGFTLIEILVVLVIVAAMAALLVFSFHDSSQQRLRREANDFAALLNAAADEAVMRGIELGVVVDDEGYRFVVFDPETKQWQAAIERGLAAHKFPERYKIDFALDGSEVDEQVIERIKLLAQHSEDERTRPSILILSSGEITPFKLTLRPDGEATESESTQGVTTLRCDGLNPVVLDLNPAAHDAGATAKDRS